MKPFVRKAGTGMFAAVFALAMTGSTIAPALAADPGVSDTEIVLGGTHPYSGPASAYGNIGKGIAAYFSYVNDKGGVNGRKIKYIDKDDGYSPPQAVQIVHQLVEQDKVFAIFDTLGTAVNTAIRPYLNDNKVPQLFVATGATTWGKDTSKFPWTIGWQPDYQAEGVLYAQDVLREHPKAKIGVLYQNDDYGEDMNAGLKRGLGSHQNLICKMASYETSDPSVSSQIASLKAAGCDTFMIFATPKFAIQAMVLAAQQSWHPVTYLNNVANAIPYMRAAEKAGGPSAIAGILTTVYLKDPANPARFGSDPGHEVLQRGHDQVSAGRRQRRRQLLVRRLDRVHDGRRAQARRQRPHPQEGDGHRVQLHREGQPAGVPGRRRQDVAERPLPHHAADRRALGRQDVVADGHPHRHAQHEDGVEVAAWRHCWRSAT